MKRALLSLIIGSAVAAPITAQADASFYGSIRLTFEKFSDDNEAADKDISVGSSGSRFGLRGSEEIGNGLKISGRYEFGVKADKGQISSSIATDTDGDGFLDSVEFANRLSYLSLEGGFGELQVGTLWSTYWNATGDAFPGNDFTGDGVITSQRLTDSVKWTKTFGRGKISVLAQLDDGLVRSQGSLGLNLNGFGVVIGLDSVSEGHFHSTLNLNYLFENGIGLHAMVQNKDPDNGTDAIQGYNLNGVYSANDNTFILSYGDSNTGIADDETLSVELARKLGERSRGWVSLQNGDAFNSVSLGLRHDW